MRSLLARIFLSFWLIIGLTIGIAAVAGYWYAERMRDAFEDFSIGDSLLEAGTALESGGREGLVRWLNEVPKSRAVTLFVVDERGQDLLGRNLPRGIGRRIDRHLRTHPRRNHDRREPQNIRRAQPLPQLVSTDGEIYTFIVAPTRSGPFHWTNSPAGLVVLALALVTSAAVSYLLARAITRPVAALRDATIRFASGDLRARVGNTVGSRHDELGGLARDFDQMAAELEKAIAQQTELSRNVSHELRSPLARLRVALELARRKTGSMPEFDKIDAEAERLDQLIAQILSYTKFELLPEQQRQLIDLGELIHDVVEDVNFECKSSGVSESAVTAEVMGGVVLNGYREALNSAIENVLRNAVIHSPAANDVNITLTTNARGESVITVSDKGPGVDDGELLRLFEPFYRTARTAAQRSSGTGLGLAIARRAVQLNGGRISASNRTGGGLEVVMTFPPGV